MTDFFKINESNLKELFFDTDKLQHIFNKNLETLQLDFPTSDLGIYKLKTEKKGQFYLTNSKSYFHKNILMKGYSIENIAIYFIKTGRGADFTHKKNYFYKANSHNVLFMNEGLMMKGIHAKEIEQDATSLHFSRDYFKILTERYPELFGMPFLRYEKGESFYLNDKYSMVTSEIYQVLWQLENSHLMGSSNAVYADAKALELLSMCFVANNRNYKRYKCCKTEADYDKIHEAAFILTSDIHQPPTIRNLSLKVGINEKKLKYGFKEVFGLTIYGYLFEHKMNLANKLLQDTDKSIFEIAELCGYKYTSHFCTAFKRRYGISANEKRK